MATDKLVDFDHVTDYISREAAWNGIYSCPTKTDADGYIWVRTKDVAHMIDEIPAADVRPVVYGAWERPKGSTPRSWIFVCSKCGDRAYFPVPKYFPKGCGYNYCPNCGADMTPPSNGEK